MIAETRLLPGAEAIDVYFASAFAASELSSEDAHIWHYLLVTLSACLRQGHTCLALTDVAERAPFWAETDDVCFPSLATLEAITGEALGSTSAAQALVYERGLLYSQRYYTFECDAVTALHKRSKPEPLSDSAITRCQALWPHLFDTSQHSEQDWQQVAVAGSLSQRFCIINGGPGTGKTYTVARLMLALQAMSESPLTIQLAAPTGKAAQRLRESVAGTLANIDTQAVSQLCEQIPDDAVTLHRLLGVSQYGVETRYNANNPLPLDVLIVDEASMVDLALMARVLRALPAHARLYLVGDADQLPAVESGNVLDALIHPDSQVTALRDGVHPDARSKIARLCPHLPLLSRSDEAVPWVYSLQASQRFGGDLAVTAEAIRQGNGDAAWQSLSPLDTAPKAYPDSAVSVAPLPATVNALNALARDSMQGVVASQSPEQALAAIMECRWLTPVKKGAFGVEQLNILLENVISGAAPYRVGAHYQGRAVMVTRNHYAQGLFNGDVGVIWPDSKGQLKAWFESAEGSLRPFNLSRLPTVETAFAMTIHKSQGSEFGRVIMVLAQNDNAQAVSLYHRGLLYTGLTRAKKQCLILSDKRTFTHMVRSRDRRFSGLRQRMHSTVTYQAK